MTNKITIKSGRLEKVIYHATTDKVAHIFNTIAYVIFFLGGIGGFIISFKDGGYAKQFSLLTLIIAWSSVFISGMIFLGFSRVIELLNDIAFSRCEYLLQDIEGTIDNNPITISGPVQADLVNISVTKGSVSKTKKA